jgi:putative peptidoglycan lipid II flippase
MSNDSSPSTSTASPAARSWGVLFNSGIVMVGFLLSRVIGLVRESMFGAAFGTDAISDIYKTAFQIPDLLYLVIIGGALGSAFIPVFSEALTTKNVQRAWQITNTVVNIALILLVAVSALIALLAGPLLSLIYPDFTPEQHALLVYLTRLFLLSPLLLGLGGLAMATLNALDRFTLPALAPVIYNASIIVGIVVFAPWFARSGWARYPASVIVQPDGRAVSIEGVAWGVVVGALLYLLFQLPGVFRAGFRYRPLLEWRDSAVRRIGMLMAPRVFGQAAMQINLIVMNVIALKLADDGQATALNQAYQLMLLPHGIFALSLATVMFPQLARFYAAGNTGEFASTVRGTLRTVLWTVIPAAVGMAALSVPIVRVIFQRGLFNDQSTSLVASALIFYATALPAFAASEVLIRGFYAMQDTRTPVVVGLITVAVNIALSALFVLALHWGHAALAGAFSIANNLEAALLLILLGRRWGQLDPTGRLRRSVRRSLLGAGAMGLALLGLGVISSRRYPFLYAADPGYSGAGADLRLLIGWLGLAVGLGAGLYALLALAQGSEELKVWQERLLRRRR